MRVARGIAVLLALVCTPFVIGAAQGPAEKCSDKSHPANRGATRSADAPGQAKKVCDEPETPAPPPPPPPTSGGSSEIHGASFSDLDISFSWSTGEPGLSGVVIELFGPITASTTTDASGAYSFTGVPAGLYIVCQQPQVGSWQTLPTEGAVCPSGMIGYILGVPSGETVRYIGNDFGNAPIQ